MFDPDFAPAFDPANRPITIVQRTIGGDEANFDPLVSFGSAQAIFFMMFTAMAGANSLLEERRAGTLQRQIASPTPRLTILLGKLIATFVTCLFQVAILIVALTLIGSLIAGSFQFIWGTNFVLLALVVTVVSLAAAGLGALVAALVKTPEQGNVIGGVISIIFGLFSGAFFDLRALPGYDVISRLTVNFWGCRCAHQAERRHHGHRTQPDRAADPRHGLFHGGLARLQS